MHYAFQVINHSMCVFVVIVIKSGADKWEIYQMRRITAFPTRLNVRPAKTQISLRCLPEDALDAWLPTECVAKTLIGLRGYTG